MIKIYSLILILFLGCMVLFQCFIGNLSSSEKPSLQRIAVIYAGRNFHEEVTASLSCMMQELGYKVVVYIEN